jgi:hypothetical protein
LIAKKCYLHLYTLLNRKRFFCSYPFEWFSFHVAFLDHKDRDRRFDGAFVSMCPDTLGTPEIMLTKGGKVTYDDFAGYKYPNTCSFKSFECVHLELVRLDALLTRLYRDAGDAGDTDSAGDAGDTDSAGDAGDTDSAGDADDAFKSRLDTLD